VLNGKNKETWPSAARRAEAIRRIARQIGYRPHAAARMMRSRSSKHVGILTSGVHNNSYEFPVIVGLNGRLQEKGYSLSVINAEELDPPRAKEALALREDFLTGLFLMHVPEAVRALAEETVPLRVWLDSNVRGPHNCIYRDEYHAGRLATEKMLEHGHDDFLFLGSRPWPDCHVSALDRVRGYEDALRERGLKAEVFLIGFGVEEPRERADELLSCLRPGQAVITTGHLLAEWCVHAAGRRGLCAGRDFALASCTEELECLQAWPWLSRVGFDRYSLGRQAADMMLALLGGQERVESVVVRGAWIEGETARWRGKGS
jgi:LacI family transcriptional regulator